MMVDEMPAHKAMCDGTEMDGPCAACHWMRDRQLEHAAYERFLHLFDYVPCDIWRRTGWG